MTRKVIEGTPSAPITVRPNDLPTNADFSYLRHVRLRGNWGSSRSLRYVDLIDSSMDADLRRADILGMDTWNTNSDGIKLTAAQADMCMPDLALGYIRPRAQAHLNSLGIDPAVYDAMFSHAGTGYQDMLSGSLRTWKIWITRFMQASGVTAAEMRSILDHIFGDLPSTRQLQRDIETDAPEHLLRIFRLTPDAEAWTEIPATNFAQPLRAAVQRRDRWQVARAAESAASVPLVALCRQIFPNFDLVATPRALIANPDDYRMTINGNTPAERLNTLLSEPNAIFGPRKC